MQGTVITVPSQTSNVPDNSALGAVTVATTVFTLAEGERGFIQNQATTALAVSLGGTPTTTTFHRILAGGTGAKDGLGGAWMIDNFIGAVTVLPMSGTSSYIAWKQKA